MSREQRAKEIQQLVNRRKVLNSFIDDSFSKLACTLNLDITTECYLNVCTEHRQTMDRIQQDLEQCDNHINELITSLVTELSNK